MIQETFAAQAMHFDMARRAQMENQFTTQNQVVELQRTALQSQAKSQSVSENKSSSQSTSTKQKQEGKEFVSYEKDGTQKTKNLTAVGSRFNSLA